ncbi:hypothetical protein JHK85_000678 [Glycine max]|nr:hypothetical protein JHK85_000678 [Glycine max]
MKIVVVPEEGNQSHHDEEWAKVSNAREKGVKGANDDGPREEKYGCASSDVECVIKKRFDEGLHNPECVSTNGLEYHETGRPLKGYKYISGSQYGSVLGIRYHAEELKKLKADYDHLEAYVRRFRATSTLPARFTNILWGSHAPDKLSTHRMTMIPHTYITMREG